MSREETLRVKLDRLREEHRDLETVAAMAVVCREVTKAVTIPVGVNVLRNDAISALAQTTAPDQLALRRLKKKKLALKDEIARIEDELYPDIIA